MAVIPPVRLIFAQQQSSSTKGEFLTGEFHREFLCSRLMIFGQVQNWPGGINASRNEVEKVWEYWILFGLFVRINYCNANDIIYIYIQILDRDAKMSFNTK